MLDGREKGRRGEEEREFGLDFWEGLGHKPDPKAPLPKLAPRMQTQRLEVGNTESQESFKSLSRAAQWGRGGEEAHLLIQRGGRGRGGARGEGERPLLREVAGQWVGAPTFQSSRSPAPKATLPNVSPSSYTSIRTVHFLDDPTGPPAPLAFCVDPRPRVDS